MREGPGKNLSREERLAAKLRENLTRRKAQSRAAPRALDDSQTTQPLPKPGDAG